MLYTNKDKERCLIEKEEVEVGRTAFRRDFGRLLHSPSFRRLQGKTQLFPGDESDFFRNRLTHSLEVAQIAKGIAQLLNTKYKVFKDDPIDLDLIEFAGMAHDLGHPPFGHNGEKALNDAMKEFGGFEGNAQTLRILAKTEKKINSTDEHPSGITCAGQDCRLGLNLTYRSLASILKYDTEIPLQGTDGVLQKGYYKSEAELVQQIKHHVNPCDTSPADFKTIECQIMDIADDIAYSTYDFEDSMKGGFTHPLELFIRVGEEDTLNKITEKVSQAVDDVTKEEVFQAVIDTLPIEVSSASTTEKHHELVKQATLYKESMLLANDGRLRTSFSSDLVGSFIRGISVEPAFNLVFSKLVVDRSIKIRIESFKHINYMLTILSPRLRVVEYRGYGIVSELFTALNDPKVGESLFPDDLRVINNRLQDEQSKMRLICDFIAGMTDRYAAEFHGRLYGVGTSIFKPI